MIGVVALEKRPCTVPFGEGEFSCVRGKDGAAAVGMATDEGTAFDGQLTHSDLPGEDCTAPAAGGVAAIETAVLEDHVSGRLSIYGASEPLGVVAYNGTVPHCAVGLADHIERAATAFPAVASGIVGVAGFVSAEAAVIKICTGTIAIAVDGTAAICFVAFEYGIPHADVPFAGGASCLRPYCAAAVISAVGRYLVAKETGAVDIVVDTDPQSAFVTDSTSAIIRHIILEGTAQDVKDSGRNVMDSAAVLSLVTVPFVRAADDTIGERRTALHISCTTAASERGTAIGREGRSCNLDSPG